MIHIGLRRRFSRILYENPISIWIKFLYRAMRIEKRYKNNALKIGYMSNVVNCEFGEYNTIYNHVYLENVVVDNYTYVSNGSKIYNATIGKFCSIGPDCKIGLGKHPSRDFVSTHPIFFSILFQSQITFADRNYFPEFEKISIGNDVWIGASVIILDGVTIGDGAIIGAGSIVTKDVPSYAIVGGVPAKLIRYRFEKDIIDKLLSMQWWNNDIDYLRTNFKKWHNIKRIID